MSSSIISFDSSSLLNYYNAKINVALTSAAARAPASAASSSSTDTASTPPWQSPPKLSQQTQDSQVLSTTNLFDTSTAQLTSAGSDSKTQADNQKLFSLYQAVSTLSYLSSMGQRDGMTSGQLSGFNTRFQSGLDQIQSYLDKTQFNNLTLQAANPTSSVTSSVSVPSASFAYTGATVVSDANVGTALPGISASDSFTVSVKKGGVTTNVPIDLSSVQGALTTDNIVAAVNQQLKAAGFTSHFSRTITKGSIEDPKTAAYGISITPGAGETVSLSAPTSSPSLYMVGNSGSVAGTDTTDPDQTGRLVKLTNLDTSATTQFSKNVSADSGVTTAQATAVDANGNIYVLGNSTGSFGNQLNQASQDVYLTKYDSAGNTLWTQMVGSADSASGYSLALDPTGGVVIAGSTTANLTPDAIGIGNSDSFVAKYDANGGQTWIQQLKTLSTNQGQAVTVDASGNVYLGGQVKGIVGAGQTSAGGTDAYVAKLDAKGKVLSEQQMGTSGADQVNQMAMTADGGLVVASVQNGHAILSKYAGGDATSAPVWQQDLGALGATGAIGGLTVSGNEIYLSGTTTNTSLDASGQATVAAASSGGADAFVFHMTDGGTSATPDTVSYVGTSAGEKGGGVTVGADGTVYLTGTTKGTFTGQTRNVANTDNIFVSAVNSDGSVGWTRQYGGADGQSSGAAVAIDPNGSSILDALGLPRGTISLPQSVDLASSTTLRAGDSFEVDIAGSAARTVKITIDKGETMRSLATKISASLAFAGTATSTYAHGGQALQIKLNKGVTATLVSGPADFDALARLGIPAGTLTNAATGDDGNVFGLGLTGTLDISSKTGAGAAHATLQNVLSAIKNAYTKTNTPASSASTTPNASSGTAPAYLQAQIANYSTALSLFS